MQLDCETIKFSLDVIYYIDFPIFYKLVQILYFINGQRALFDCNRYIILNIDNVYRCFVKIFHCKYMLL